MNPREQLGDSHQIGVTQDGGQPDLTPHYLPSREAWADAPVVKARYNDGIVSGERLIINGSSVMEEWEKPLQETTVDLLLAGNYGEIRGLIRGEGTGYATAHAIKRMAEGGGGELSIIEMHPVIREEGEKRVKRLLAKLSPEQRDKLKVRFIQGDAVAVTKDLPNNYFDFILSDTYPLTPEEKDINDMGDLETILEKLKSSGAFSPFIGYEALTQKQFDALNGMQDFRRAEILTMAVHPPKDCPYFQGSEMIILVLKGVKRKSGVVFDKTPVNKAS